MTETERIKAEAWRIVTDARANRIERIEGLKLICAARGILLPEVREDLLDRKQTVQLRKAKQELIEKALRKKAQRSRANRKSYLKRKIALLEQLVAQSEGRSLTATGAKENNDGTDQPTSNSIN